MKPITFATYRQQPNLDYDDELVAAHLKHLGVTVTSSVWNDNCIQWDMYDAVIIRSCWDYHHQSSEFMGWLDELDVPVWNSPKLVHWNTDKNYLIELGEKSVPIPKTVSVDQKQVVNLRDFMQEHQLTSIVIKPRINAGGHNTFLWKLDDDVVLLNAQQSLNNMLQKSAVIIQQYISEIAINGEWSFIFINGNYSHALLKRPAGGDFRVQGYFGGKIDKEARPSENLIKQANSIVDKIPYEWLYARVDAVNVENKLILMELELIEPSLYFWLYPEASREFANAIFERVYP